MPLIYVQRSGRLLDPHGRLIGTGAAGHGPGWNNPAMQTVRGVGPLPVGHYMIGPAYDDPHLGPCVMRLYPDPANVMFTRGDFLIHGFSKLHYALSSDGCICQGPTARLAVAASEDRGLNVVAEDRDARPA